MCWGIQWGNKRIILGLAKNDGDQQASMGGGSLEVVPDE
jgi:hypothetical protein